MPGNTAQPEQPVDLSNCDREPIHILGAIQPFGALVAVSSDWLIGHFSANAAAFFGTPQLALGQPLRDSFTPHAMDTLRDALRALPDNDTTQRVFALDLTGSGALFDVAVHLSGRMIVIEAERHDAQAHLFSLNALRPLMARLEQVSDVSELCQQGAQAMAGLLGLSRVMVYKFHGDNSGEVVAEMIEPGQDSFLGLRYPASDIPKQARALYLKNLLRIIANVDDERVPLVPVAGIGGQPLDLSLSTLRAVSPIHIEYLRNMGVASSLSVSIVVRGRLWGLFACHHYQPLTLPFSLRTTAELFAQLFALLLDQRIGDESRELAERGKAMHNRVMAQLADTGDLIDNLSMITDAIAPLVRHDGASAFIAGSYTNRGFAPNEEEFRMIVPGLNSAAASSVIADSNLSESIPTAADFASRATGALVIPVSRSPRDYIVLWRRPLTQTVVWAGNPEKPAEYGPNGARLTPRKSFEAWRQTVHDRSEPWSDDEVRIADMLRVTLLEVLLRLSDQANADRAAAQQKQELLIAELNHRVRNILTLIRSLIGQSRHEARDMEDFTEIVGGRIRALAMAHDAITRENWNPASLRQLIMVEAEAYLSDKAERLKMTGTDVLITPEAYTVLALVIHELMTNSAKYGSLCDRSGVVDINLSLAPGGDVVMRWAEVGGPPVQAPTRRGFGSTIIERSLPHELKGTAEVDYRFDGLIARFCIPARYVVATGRDLLAEPEDYSAAGPKQSAAAPGGPVKRVLVVEDNMIIALDTEDLLIGLGVPDVSVAGSVAGARALLVGDRFDLAILDFNLGNETSVILARDLAADGVRVVFATGYGDAVARIAEVPHSGILKKPYSRDDLKAVLENASAD